MDRPKRLLGALGTLLGGIAISKILGLGRELLLAFAFGTTYVADAFRVALSAILLPTHLITGEALFGAFIPAYKRLTDPARIRLARAVATAVAGLSVVITAILLVAAPSVAAIFAPGFDEQATVLTARLIRVASAGVILYTISALFINIQVAHGDYLAYSARPIVQNLGILAAVAVAYAWEEPLILGFGFVVSFCVMSAWSLSQLKKLPIASHEILKPTLSWPKKETFEFLKAAGELSLFVVLIQISGVVDRIVASLTGEGGVAAVDYAFFITDSARVVIGVPFATLVIGRLGGSEWSVARRTARRMIAPLLVCTLALSILVFAVAYDVINVLYSRGEFQSRSIELTGASLQGFSVGMWAASTGYVLLRLFNATLRNREVALAGTAGLLINIVLDLILYRPMGVLGIALATSVSNLVVLGILIHRAELGLETLRKAAIPALGIAALTPILVKLAGHGLWSMTIVSAIVVVGTGAFSSAWTPLRRDIIWALRRMWRRLER